MHHDTFADTVAGAAHGGCAEPGGIVDLTDTAGSAACRRCGQPARWWHLDRVEGESVKTYSGLSCDACGECDGVLPDEGR
jgi:heterodisulfide reductase subunit A-like polyferredoxin